MPIKAIIHDWDDTITNSIESYAKYYIDFGEYFNLSKISLKTIKAHWSKTIAEIAVGLWPDISFNEAEHKLGEFKKVLKKRGQIYHASVFPGVKETFEKLHGAGIKLGVISSGSRAQIERIYREQLDEDMKFHDFIYDHDDLGYRKPDPRVFDEPMKRLMIQGIKEGEVVYVGDSIIDLEVSRNRGVAFYAVTTGVKTKKDFLEHGLKPANILETFDRVLEVI